MAVTGILYTVGHGEERIRDARGAGSARRAYFLDPCPSSSGEIRVEICQGGFLKQSADSGRLQGFIGEADSSAKAPACILGACLTVIKNNPVRSLFYSLRFSVRYSPVALFSKGKAAGSAPAGSVVER